MNDSTKELSKTLIHSALITFNNSLEFGGEESVKALGNLIVTEINAHGGKGIIFRLMGEYSLNTAEFLYTAEVLFDSNEKAFSFGLHITANYGEMLTGIIKVSEKPKSFWDLVERMQNLRKSDQLQITQE